MYEDGRTIELLLGDSGYPCLPYLMTTMIMNGITMKNRSHIMTRNIIERLFGDDNLHCGLRTSLILIVACCVLHNIARRHREVDNVNVELNNDHDNDIIDPNMLPPVNPRGNFVSQGLVQQFI